MPTLARLYQHADYKGSFKDIVLLNNFPMPRYVVASYNNFFYNFNDRMSSFKVYPFPQQSKNSFVFFQHSNFDGKGQSYGYHSNRDVNYVGNNLNDIASSALIINHSDILTIGNYILGGGVSFQDLANSQNLRNQFENELKKISQGPLQKVILRNSPITFKFELDSQNNPLIRVHLPVRLIFKDPLPDDNIEIYIWLKIDDSSPSGQLDITVPYNPKIEGLRPLYQFVFNLIKLLLPKLIRNAFNSFKNQLNDSLKKFTEQISLVYSVGPIKVKFKVYLLPGNAVINQPLLQIQGVNIPLPIKVFTLKDYYISNADYDCTLIFYGVL